MYWETYDVKLTPPPLHKHETKEKSVFNITRYSLSHSVTTTTKKK
jgi:hypothetical protein